MLTIFQFLWLQLDHFGRVNKEAGHQQDTHSTPFASPGREWELHLSGPGYSSEDVLEAESETLWSYTKVEMGG